MPNSQEKYTNTKNGYLAIIKHDSDVANMGMPEKIFKTADDWRQR